MKLSRSVSYALGILLRVADQGAGQPLTAAKIAKGCNYPPRFLYRILRRLVAAKLLVGASGPGGGYRLARRSDRISVWDVVVAIEGPLRAESLIAMNRKQKRAIDAINRVSQQTLNAFQRKLAGLKISKLAKMR